MRFTSRDGCQSVHKLPLHRRMCSCRVVGGGGGSSNRFWGGGAMFQHWVVEEGVGYGVGKGRGVIMERVRCPYMSHMTDDVKAIWEMSQHMVVEEGRQEGGGGAGWGEGGSGAGRVRREGGGWGVCVCGGGGVCLTCRMSKRPPVALASPRVQL